jgi:hypothetical protein
MSFLTERQSGIDDQLAEAGEALSLSRSGQSVAITGIHGNPERSVSQGNATIGGRETSFIVLTSEYKPTGVISEPRIGDRITRDFNGQVFEVLRPESGLDFCEDYGGIGYAWRVMAGKVSP